jgi:hypothetical protein
VNEKMLYVVIVGLAGALLMFAGDMLLYYTPEDFAYDSKSSSAEKIQAILIASGHTLLPRWMFLLSPGILFLLRPAVARLPKGIRIIVSGGWTNWISVIYYLAVLFGSHELF